MIWLSVGCHLHISKISPAQQTIDQKLTLWLFDQLCVNQIYLTTFKVSVALLDGSPEEKVFNGLIYQSILTQNWLFFNKVKNVKFVIFKNVKNVKFIWMLLNNDFMIP